MSDKNDMVFDDQSAERPLNLSSGGVDRKSNSAVKSLTGNNPRGELNTDDAQHMKKMRNYLIAFAGVNSMMNHHHRKQYMKAAKAVTGAEENMRAQQNHPGASGVHGRSIEEIFAEDKLKDAKKKLEKLQKKYPNLQRPQSFKENMNKSVRTVFSGIGQALRAQTMKGVAQANAGSDVRAMAAAEVAGYIPGADVQSDVQMEV